MISLLIALVCAPTSWKPCVVSTYDNPKHIYFEGKRTSNGERYTNRKLTGAVNYHFLRRFPFGTIVEISRHGFRTRIRINDTGGHRCRKQWFDISGRAMRQLIGKWEDTTVRAKYRIISYPKKKHRR